MESKSLDLTAKSKDLDSSLYRMNPQPPTNPSDTNHQKDVLQQATGLAQQAGPLAEILYAISYVLPTFLANPLRQLANTLRRTDMAAKRIEKATDKLKRS